MAIGMSEVREVFNPDNFTVPNRISVWFAPIDSKGVQREYFELGNAEDININLEETFAEKSSARKGVFAVARRLVSSQQGQVTMMLSEVVKRNLEVILRSKTVTNHTDAGSNAKIIHEVENVRLNGTTAAAVGDTIAQEGDGNGRAFFRALTVLRVTDVGGGTTYTATTDYTFTNAVEGASHEATLTFGGFTAGTGDTITLPEETGTLTLVCGTDFVTGATAGTAAALAADVARAINAQAKSNVASVAGAVVTVAYLPRQTTAPADIVTADVGGTINTDLGAGTHTYSGGSATTSATIARVALGAIPDGSEVRVEYTFAREACSYSFQDGLTVEGALKIQLMSTNGIQCYWQFWKVSTSMEGDASVNHEEFMSLGLNCRILSDGRGRRGEFVLLKRFPQFSVESGSCV